RRVTCILVGEHLGPAAFMFAGFCILPAAVFCALPTGGGANGGLLAYGPRFEQVYRQRARIVVKLLRGAKAAEIPVEQPSVFELVVNLQTAKTIGHHVPEALIHRADKVIE